MLFAHFSFKENAGRSAVLLVVPVNKIQNAFAVSKP